MDLDSNIDKWEEQQELESIDHKILEREANLLVFMYECAHLFVDREPPIREVWQILKMDVLPSKQDCLTAG